jgi:hypothetical protein
MRLWGRTQPIALATNLFSDEDDRSSASSVTASDANYSRLSLSQLILEQRESTATSSGALPQDPELLRRARAAHSNADVAALAAGPEQGGPWRCVETIDRFSVYRRQQHEAAIEGRSTASEQHDFRPEVLCAGRLDASLDEVARILCPSSEADHNAVMRDLYAKNFIFGSIEHKVKCVQRHNVIAEQAIVDGEQLAVKTSSFVHTSLFGHNEQWCYLDFFQRKPERDGFTISQCALRPHEATPGRIKASHARVHQLHGLSAAYLVNQLPGRSSLRVVFHSWFDPIPPSSDSSRRGGKRRSFSDSTLNASTPTSYCSETKAQVRRLLALAHGVAQLPECVRHRRFSVHVPNAPEIDNPRCPCCTCRLSTVRLTLATGLSDWKRLKKKRCYLCGYLVCGWCWSTAQMETDTGRVASIVACTRCQASLEVNRPDSHGSDEPNASGACT